MKKPKKSKAVDQETKKSKEEPKKSKAVDQETSEPKSKAEDQEPTMKKPRKSKAVDQETKKSEEEPEKSKAWIRRPVSPRNPSRPVPSSYCPFVCACVCLHVSNFSRFWRPRFPVMPRCVPWREPLPAITWLAWLPCFRCAMLTSVAVHLSGP